MSLIFPTNLLIQYHHIAHIDLIYIIQYFTFVVGRLIKLRVIFRMLGRHVVGTDLHFLGFHTSPVQWTQSVHFVRNPIWMSRAGQLHQLSKEVPT